MTCTPKYAKIYHENAKNGGRLAPLRREVMCMVTYEALFLFAQTLMLTVTSVTAIITLVITIVKLYAKHSDTKNKRKK